MLRQSAVRKSYDKPTISLVRMVPQEAVLAECKTTGGPVAPLASQCNISGIQCISDS